MCAVTKYNLTMKPELGDHKLKLKVHTQGDWASNNARKEQMRSVVCHYIDLIAFWPATHFSLKLISNQNLKLGQFIHYHCVLVHKINKK